MSTAEQNKSLGAYGEAVAARMLVTGGMVLLDRNWRCAIGEIDLVLRDGDVLVFCEVKTRRNSAYGHPLEAVTPEKAQRMMHLAELWIEDHDVHPAEVRVDLVGVLRPERGAALVEHVVGVG